MLLRLVVRGAKVKVWLKAILAKRALARSRSGEIWGAGTRGHRKSLPDTRLVAVTPRTRSGTAPALAVRAKTGRGLRNCTAPGGWAGHQASIGERLAGLPARRPPRRLHPSSRSRQGWRSSQTR